MRRLIICLLIVITSPALAADITSFVVQEAKRSDESGWARTNDPVTIGIPLPENGGYKNTSSFGLTGATAGQFKITGWWPNGNAQWVTVDLQTSLTAAQVKTGFALTNSGSGNFGGSDLATDGVSVITVNTGAATFTIKKANFNVFDSVVVGSDTLVSSGNSGGFKLVDTSSVAYSSANDSSSTAVVEENGPLRAVVVSSGSLKTSGGTRFCDYEARLTFYKDKAYVKGLVSLRHAKWSDYNTTKQFYSSELTVPLTIGATKTVLLTTKDSEVTRSLGASDTAYIYQGHSSHPLKVNAETQGGEDGWEPPIPKTGSNPWTLASAWFGQEMVVGAETIQAKGTEGTWTQGYADLSDSSGKGLSVAMRYMPQYYPAGFDIKGDGNVSIELFSKRNNNTICKFGWSKWESREVLWDFHSSTNNKAASFRTLQNPLIGRAPFEYYRVNKAFGTDKIATVAEEQQFYSDEGETAPDFNDQTYTSSPIEYPWRAFFRSWPRPLGGITNFIDTPASDLLDWIRTGYAGYYVFAEQRLFFDAYSGPRRSDDWELEHNDSYAVWKNGANMSGSSFDSEHHYIQGLPWIYFFTGNNYYKVACFEDAEWNQRYSSMGAEGVGLPGSIYFRAWSRTAMPSAIYYDFSRTVREPKEYLADTLAEATTYIVDSREDKTNITAVNDAYRGRDMNRGYVYWDTTVNPGGRVVWSFFHTQIHFNAMYEVMRSLKKWDYSYSRIDEFEDYLTGLSQFIYNEYMQCSGVIWGGKCGFEYGYQMHKTRSEAISSSAQLYWDINPYPASRPYIWYYSRTGVDKQDKADKAATWSGKNKRQSSDLQEQALIYQHIHQDISPDVTITPSIVNNGGGSYTLSWTVPSGINKYKIKYSTKQIVDWLGYDRDSKIYLYDPANYTPFFAATNVSGEPIPSAVGTTQNVTLTGLPTSGVNFAMKGMKDELANQSAPVIKNISIQ